MKVNSIQNYNLSFNAKLQLSGNTKLLNPENVKCLKNTVENIGTKSDIIAIKLPETLKEDALISFAGFVNGVNVQISESFDKNDGLMTALTKGLNNLKERVEDFLVLKSRLDEYGIMPVEKIK